MAKAPQTAITPTRADDYPEWYQQVVRAADLAEARAVRGCMVIKPWGYALWENMQRVLDRMFKETGHSNAYFPLFIPLSYLEKEAEHVEGFAKECAVVTHHRLEAGPGGKLVPTGKLEEPLVVRPTSETIIGANVCQVGAVASRLADLDQPMGQRRPLGNADPHAFCARPNFCGKKVTRPTPLEKKPRKKPQDARRVCHLRARLHGHAGGARRKDRRRTLSRRGEHLQHRGHDAGPKALQSGTSHFLGQNFRQGSRHQVPLGRRSRGVRLDHVVGSSTRLIGGLIMTHSDDDGLVLPPRLAPQHVVILPIYRQEEERASVLEYCERCARN